MSKDRGRDRAVETWGGYPAGPKLVSELAPPPKGPAPGANPNVGKGGGKKSASKP